MHRMTMMIKIQLDSKKVLRMCFSSIEFMEVIAEEDAYYTGDIHIEKNNIQSKTKGFVSNCTHLKGHLMTHFTASHYTC